MRWMCVVAAIAGLSITAHAEDLFPLQVANMWRYECQYLPGRPPHAGEAVCAKRDSGDVIQVTLSVGDATAVPHSASGILAVVPEIQPGQDGETYHVLTGDALPIFVTQYSLECAGFGPGVPVDQLLVRVGGPTPFSITDAELLWWAQHHSPDEVNPGLWLRGVHAAGNWWLFKGEHLLWDLTPAPPGNWLYVAHPDGGRCLDWQFERTWNPEAMLGRASVYPVDLVIWCGDSSSMDAGYALGLRSGIGIVQISEYVLVEAVIDGKPVPLKTSVQMQSWGQLKFQVQP